MIFETVTVPGADLQKLLGAASGDAALLYLYIKAGNDPENAGQAAGNGFRKQVRFRRG